MTTQLSPHFTLEELDGVAAPSGVQSSLRFTANKMEAFREIIGTAFVVTSGYRTPQHNAEVGGSETSDHVNGLALDGHFSGRTMWQVYNRLMVLKRAGGLPAFDQIILYPYTTGHIHFGFGGKMRGDVMAKLIDGSYSPVTSAIEYAMPGWGGPPIGPGTSQSMQPQTLPVLLEEDNNLGLYIAGGITVLAGLLAWLWNR